jgi:hypothetical protein
MSAVEGIFVISLGILLRQPMSLTPGSTPENECSDPSRKQNEAIVSGCHQILTALLRESHKKHMFLQKPLGPQSVYLSIIKNGSGTVVTTRITTFTPPNVVLCVLSVVACWRRTETKVGSPIRCLLVAQIEVYDNLTVDLTALSQPSLILCYVKILYLLTDGVQTETTVVTMGYTTRKKLQSVRDNLNVDATTTYRLHLDAPNPRIVDHAPTRPPASFAQYRYWQLVHFSHGVWCSWHIR